MFKNSFWNPFLTPFLKSVKNEVSKKVIISKKVFKSYPKFYKLGDEFFWNALWKGAKKHEVKKVIK